MTPALTLMTESIAVCVDIYIEKLNRHKSPGIYQNPLKVIQALRKKISL